MTDTELALKAAADVMREQFAKFSDEIAALRAAIPPDRSAEIDAVRKAIPQPKDYGPEIASLRAALDDKARYARFSERTQVEALAAEGQAAVATLAASVAALQAAVDSVAVRVAALERTETTTVLRDADGRIESFIKRVG